MSPNNSHLRQYASPVLREDECDRRSELAEQCHTRESSRPFGFAHITKPDTSLPVTIVCLQQSAKTQEPCETSYH